MSVRLNNSNFLHFFRFTAMGILLVFSFTEVELWTVVSQYLKLRYLTEPSYIIEFVVDTFYIFHDISAPVTSNYWYLKVNFQVPENLFWDISSLISQSKFSRSQKINFEISVAGLDKSKYDLLVRCSTSATKYWISFGFPIYLIHFSGQVRKYFTCPAKIFTCQGQPDDGFVRPCL